MSSAAPATWEERMGRFRAATTSGEIIAALALMQHTLEKTPGIKEAVPKSDLIHAASEKRTQVGAETWSRDVKLAYSKLLCVYSAPVEPRPAYEGQTFPPAYLFTVPIIPTADETNRSDQLANSFCYAPPPGYKPPFDMPKFDDPAPQPSAPPVGPDPAYPSAPPGVVPTFPAGLPHPGAPALQLPSMLLIEKAPEEYTIDCTNGNEVTTDVWCDAGEAERVTHLNLFHNDVTVVQNLRKFPCLLRLTLRSNDLKSLSGLQEARYLRWLDASCNDLKNLSGVGQMEALEWVDLSDNDLPNLQGLRICPNVTFLNLHHNDLKDISGIEHMPSLRWLNLASNDLTSATGLERCSQLIELDLNFNNLTNAAVGSIVNLARRLPYLRVLHLGNNKFTPEGCNRIAREFAAVNPHCNLIFAEALSDLARQQLERETQVKAKRGSCCTMM